MKKMRMGKTKRLVVRVEKTMSITARAWRRRGRERVARFGHQANHSRTGSDALCSKTATAMSLTRRTLPWTRGRGKCSKEAL